MPREASGTYALSSRSSISVTKPLSRATPGVAAPRLSSGIYAPAVGTIPRLSRRENRSNVRPLARTNRERYGKRERDRERERVRKGEKEEGRDPAGWSEFYPRRWRRLRRIPPRSGVSRYVSRLPSASMVLSTLQKSLSTCCLSVRLFISARMPGSGYFSVATSFYAFNIIKLGITGKSGRGLLIKSCDNQQYI